MKHLLRIVVLWLLAVTLPVQGLAAAVQLACMPIQQNVISSPAMTHMHADHGAMHMSSAEHTTHAMHGADDNQQDHVQKADGKHASKCSACTACYIGSALLPGMTNLTSPFFASSGVQIAPPSLLLGYVPDGLKRPPRFSLV